MKPLRFSLAVALVIGITVNALSQNRPQTEKKPEPSTSKQPPQTERMRVESVAPAKDSKMSRGTSGSAGIRAGERLLTPEKLWSLKRVGGEALSRDGAYAYYGVAVPDVKENKTERNIFRIPVKGGAAEQITKTPGAESNVQFPANGNMIYSYKGHIYSASADGSNPQQLTKNDTGYDNVKVSPAGNKILFTRDVKVERTEKEMYPDLDKANAIITDDLMYRHWNEWNDESVPHLFIADFQNNAITNEKDILAGEPYAVPQMPMGGPEDLTWSYDGTYVVYVTKKLKGKEYALSTNTDVFRYDVATGVTTNLSEGMKGYDTKPTVSRDGKTIYWLSMARDGYESDKNDLIAYNVAAKTKTNLTTGWDNTVEDYMISSDDKAVYILSYYQGTEQLFVLSTSPSKKLLSVIPSVVTQGTFDINGFVGQTGNTLVVTRTDMNHAPELYTVDLSNGSMKQLTHTNDEAYAKLDMCKIEKRWITTSDNQKMMTWLVYPPDFDSTKKYPALLYCQGGPQSALSQFYSFRWNFQLMASQGYIVIAPNRRGMPGHGVKWNEAISKDWGGQPIRDYLTATDSMAALPFIDETRIGAVGASYGGYSVYMLAGIHQNRFKTFISHCGLFNLKSWYGTTEELWFANWDIGGSYWDKSNAELYTKADPINYAQNWNRPILVFHGEKDFRVPVNQGMEAFQLAQLKGLKSRMVLFPDEGHWITQPHNGLLWQREFYKWLGETL